MKYILFFLLYFFSSATFPLENLPPMQADDIKLAVNFFAALKECQVGKFNTVFQSTLIEANILGYKNKICIVELSREDKNRILIKKRCEFPPASLELLSDKAVAITSAFVKKNVQEMLGQAEVSIDNTEDIDIIVKTFNKYCKST